MENKNKLIKLEKIDNCWVLYKLDVYDVWQPVYEGTLHEMKILKDAFIEIGFNCSL